MPSSADKMTRENFGELLTPTHKKIFFNTYKELPKQYPKIFKMEKMSRKEETDLHLGAFGTWEKNTEGSTFNRSKISQGQKATYVAERYDNSYEVTWELMQDDQYSVFKGIGINGSAYGLGRGLVATEEIACAKVIKDGFTQVGYDGVALFSEEHPLADSEDTCSNLIKGELTDENLKKALTLMRSQKDEAGIPIACRATRLVVCPELEFTAKAIVRSILQSGTNNNDVNTVPDLEIVVMDYLADETNKIWFIQDATYENLKFKERESAHFRSERIPDTMDWRMIGYKRWAQGYSDWRGLVGSKGINE